MSAVLPEREESTLLLNPIASPWQMGIYGAEGFLHESLKMEGYVSETLVETLDRILSQNRIKRILYVSGPGSYMGIKLTYITLRTLETARGIPFAAVSAFSLNGGKPLKAMGKLYFVKEKETIITRKFDEKIPQEFQMPESLNDLEILQDREPDYRLPSV